MKRQRDSSYPSSNQDPSDRRCRSGNDCYDEIVQEGGDGESVRGSWLRQTRNPIHTNGDDDSMQTSDRSERSDEIKSLGQQLIQVKRRLWPAAETCAEAWASNSLEEFWSARAFANPMEALGECRHGGLNQMFINRSAIKLANIDAILDFQLTKIPACGADGRNVFLFADLCGAPGGFSEYITKRIQSNGISCICRGYGMSLVGKNEHGKGASWRLEDFSQSSNNSFTNYQVLYGSDGTGDIYQWGNVISFQEDVHRDLNDAGIFQRKMNLVVADGGFDAQRDSECQEGLAQKLILCEFAAALELVGLGGTLVVKLFGCQTETMRMAMRSMSDFFDTMEIIKPISSRPASSERYVVFTEFKGLPENWEGGQPWMSSVLIGRCLQRDPASYSVVNTYLDDCDRDMLVLNLKACFAILSHLERKTARSQSNRKRGGNQSVNWRQKNITIKMYKHAWRLFI